MAVCYLGLGSNKGDRLSMIKRALEETARLKDTEVVTISSLYETEPWGVSDQSYFLNCVAEVKTELEAEMFLSMLKEIERRIGRIGREKWREREIDIDLLMYGDSVFSAGMINVPHPEIEQRNFVLVPFAEIAENTVHPVSGLTIGGLLRKSKDTLEVKYFGKINLANQVWNNE